MIRTLSGFVWLELVVVKAFTLLSPDEFTPTVDPTKVSTVDRFGARAGTPPSPGATMPQLATRLARRSATEAGVLLAAAGAAWTGVCGGRAWAAALGVEGGSAFGPPFVVNPLGAVVAGTCPSVAGTAAVGPLFATLDPRTELDSEERDDAGAVLFPSDDGVEGPADVSALLVVVFAFLFDFTAGKHVHGNGVWVSTGRVGVVWWGWGYLLFS